MFESKVYVFFVLSLQKSWKNPVSISIILLQKSWKNPVPLFIIFFSQKSWKNSVPIFIIFFTEILKLGSFKISVKKFTQFPVYALYGNLNNTRVYYLVIGGEV